MGGETLNLVEMEVFQIEWNIINKTVNNIYIYYEEWRNHESMIH